MLKTKNTNIVTSDRQGRHRHIFEELEYDTLLLLNIMVMCALYTPEESLSPIAIFPRKA